MQNHIVPDHRPEAPHSTLSCVARSMSFPKAVDAKTPDVLSKNGSKVKIVQVPRINPSARTRHNEPALIRRQLFLAAPNASSLDRCRARTAGGIQPALGDTQGDKVRSARMYVSSSEQRDGERLTEDVFS